MSAEFHRKGTIECQAMGWLRLVGSLDLCLFCRIQSLFKSFFAKKTHNFKDPTIRIEYKAMKVDFFFELPNMRAPRSYIHT